MSARSLNHITSETDCVKCEYCIIIIIIIIVEWGSPHSDKYKNTMGTHSLQLWTLNVQLITNLIVLIY